MSLSINETLIIDNLDVEPYPISLDSGIVVVRAITTGTPIVQTIHDVFMEPVIVFDNHVYFSKSVLAEKYENVTKDDLPEIVLCEDDATIEIPVGSIMQKLGNEYIADPTMATNVR
jgi:hypothetical protein